MTRTDACAACRHGSFSRNAGSHTLPGHQLPQHHFIPDEHTHFGAMSKTSAGAPTYPPASLQEVPPPSWCPCCKPRWPTRPRVHHCCCPSHLHPHCWAVGARQQLPGGGPAWETPPRQLHGVTRVKGTCQNAPASQPLLQVLLGGWNPVWPRS